MADSGNASGIGNATEGHSFSWFGDGETKITANSQFLLSYGVKTDISVAVTSDLSLAAKTSLFFGAKTDAIVGNSLALKKGSSTMVANSGGFHHQDHYVGSVGEDATQKLRIARLTKATWILLGLQAASMLSLATVAAGVKIAHPDDKILKLPFVDFPIGYATSISTMAAGLASLIMITLQRFLRLIKGSQQACVLSMNSVPVVFLGARAPDGSNSSGITMDNTGIEISTADEDLEYNKPAASIIGFTNKAGEGQVGGSRVMLNTNGTIQAWSTNLDFISKGRAAHHAHGHDLIVTDAAGADTVSLFRLDATSAFIQSHATTSLKIADDEKINAVTGGAGGSLMTLEPTHSVIGTGGNQLKCEGNRVTLNFGGTTLTIDATGVDIGGALTIMKPGGGSIRSTDLSKAIQQADNVNKAQKKDRQSLQAHNKKLKSLAVSVEKLNAARVALNAKIDDLS